ncbi:hypothetical protein GRI62_09540 [Erythrobacter arachoides]|uniref:Uncharacterized protein n=1 Tax=Aurantiacibacter arachoides TaxID=1850444 RepID=A0A845A2N0_9SPHN|nr:hypothetical protein [Aurantiacibacter arachoides]MXO93850.1 hypothetical protein [Aurantiacibacter arachoides]GGD46233.1 hypothetical protein GCM10011411_02310 [Aurantiacibacter arachoides]
MTPPVALARHIRRETLISGMVNAIISTGFFFAVFGWGQPVRVWGAGHLVADLLPQGFAVAFFASMIPSFLASRAITRGALAADMPRQPSTARLVLKAFVTGLIACGIGAVVWALVFTLGGWKTVAPVQALTLKVGYGFFLGMAVTFFTLTRLLRGEDVVRQPVPGIVS